MFGNNYRYASKPLMVGITLLPKDIWMYHALRKNGLIRISDKEEILFTSRRQLHLFFIRPKDKSNRSLHSVIQLSLLLLDHLQLFVDRHFLRSCSVLDHLLLQHQINLFSSVFFDVVGLHPFWDKRGRTEILAKLFFAL
jgi:hypothetical protein